MLLTHVPTIHPMSIMMHSYQSLAEICTTSQVQSYKHNITTKIGVIQRIQQFCLDILRHCLFFFWLKACIYQDDYCSSVTVITVCKSCYRFGSVFPERTFTFTSETTNEYFTLCTMQSFLPARLSQPTTFE